MRQGRYSLLFLRTSTRKTSHVGFLGTSREMSGFPPAPSCASRRGGRGRVVFLPHRRMSHFDDSMAPAEVELRQGIWSLPEVSVRSTRNYATNLSALIWD